MMVRTNVKYCANGFDLLLMIPDNTIKTSFFDPLLTLSTEVF